MNVRVEIAQLLEQRQGRASGALGVVLVRGWIAEIDEDAVAEDLRDEPAEPFHDRERESLVATQQAVRDLPDPVVRPDPSSPPGR